MRNIMRNIFKKIKLIYDKIVSIFNKNTETEPPFFESIELKNTTDEKKDFYPFEALEKKNMTIFFFDVSNITADDLQFWAVHDIIKTFILSALPSVEKAIQIKVELEGVDKEKQDFFISLGRSFRFSDLSEKEITAILSEKLQKQLEEYKTFTWYTISFNVLKIN